MQVNAYPCLPLQLHHLCIALCIQYTFQLNGFCMHVNNNYYYHCLVCNQGHHFGLLILFRVHILHVGHCSGNPWYFIHQCFKLNARERYH